MKLNSAKIYFILSYALALFIILSNVSYAAPSLSDTSESMPIVKTRDSKESLVTPTRMSIPSPSVPVGIISNPAAVNNSLTGTGVAEGYLQGLFGIKDNHGINFGGAYLADTNGIMSGGVQNAQQWQSDSLFLLNLNIDTNKLLGWEGGTFYAQFLQFNGQNVNGQVGSVQGYNSLPVPPDFDRTELYQIWLSQLFANNMFLVRVGKLSATNDFSNVLQPDQLDQEKLYIPSVSGLIFTPVFENPTMVGVAPGYYNSAYGVEMFFLPNKYWYLSAGAYDGSGAQGAQTGLNNLPTFNGSGFYIAEAGANWLLGKDNYPGKFGIGGWDEIGVIQGATPTSTEFGAQGLYVFGSQRLWYKDPGYDISGISMYYQYGYNNSSVLPMNQSFGGGFTLFDLIPNRPGDSMGIGFSLASLNQAIFNRPDELMYQTYYQAKVINNIYLEPAVTYIPTPGASSSLAPAWTGTLRLVVLF